MIDYYKKCGYQHLSILGKKKKKGSNCPIYSLRTGPWYCMGETSCRVGFGRFSMGFSMGGVLGYSPVCITPCFVTLGRTLLRLWVYGSPFEMQELEWRT